MIGDIISGIGSIAGGIMQNKAAKKQAKLQKEFAQNAIQWKVKDAEKAGVHPLYALGANTVSFSPTAVGDMGLGQAGQDFGRAIDAGISQAGKLDVFQKTLAAIQLEGAKLDNDIKRTQIASNIATIRQAGHPPGVPTPDTLWMLDGQGDTPSLDRPKIQRQTRRDVNDPNAPWSVPGVGPGVSWMMNSSGGIDPVIPPELAESLESDNIGQWKWAIRNNVMPNFGGSPPPIPLKPGERITWDYWNQTWRVIPNPRLEFRR